MSNRDNHLRLKIALVGCGQIADAHLQEIRKVSAAELVAVCDSYQDLADQAAARFEVPRAFNDLDRLLEAVRPDVVHITTPAHTHAPLALRCLEAGAHVYVEKPFTVDADEAEDVLAAAEAHGRLVCVGHDQLFDPIWQECRRVCARGELGEIQHVEAVLAYNLRGPYGAALVSDPDHWVHRLPGGLFQNTISHPLYKILDFLKDPHPEVTATWFGRSEAISFPTELRVHVRGREVTGSLLFTSTTRPLNRIVRLYGTGGGLEVDFDAQLLRRYRDARLPGALGKIEVPFRQFREAARNLRRNVMRFLRADLHYFAGMRELFAAFYRAILEETEPPIAAAEIHRVTAVMDRIFHCCRVAEAALSSKGSGASNFNFCGSPTVASKESVCPQKLKFEAPDPPACGPELKPEWEESLEPFAANVAD